MLRGMAPIGLTTLRALVLGLSCAVGLSVAGAEEPQAGPAAPKAPSKLDRWQAFQRAVARHGPKLERRTLDFSGFVVRSGVKAGTWNLQITPRKQGGWQVHEDLRLDESVRVQREGTYTNTFFPRSCRARIRRPNGATEMTWRGQGTSLLMARRKADEAPQESRQAFGGVALSGVAPYLLLAPALEAGRYRASHVYDGWHGAAQVAARDFEVQPSGTWHGQAARLLVFQAPNPMTLALEPSGSTVLGMRLELDGVQFEVSVQAPNRSAAPIDLRSEPTTTPAIAAQRFLYALERGYLDLLSELVAWPEELQARSGAPAEEVANRRTRRRAQIERFRMDLLRNIPPSEVEGRLRQLAPRMEVHATEQSARVVLPPPYVGWELLLTRTEADLWRIEGTRYVPGPAQDESRPPR